VSPRGKLYAICPAWKRTPFFFAFCTLYVRTGTYLRMRLADSIDLFLSSFSYLLFMFEKCSYSKKIMFQKGSYLELFRFKNVHILNMFGY
jgi:hypothetical protein